MLIADAQLTLVRQSSGPGIELRDCYRFGTSKENQRIESWWSQLGGRCLWKWRVR
jgi:hypothetical protein